MGRTCRTLQMRKSCKILVGNLKERDHLGDLDEYRRMQAGFIWLRTGSIGGLL